MTPRAAARIAAALAALAVCCGAGAARAQADAGASWASCSEHVPAGATRPELRETFPERGFSGYASTLEITVKHGKGETVLPEGFRVQGSSDAMRALTLAGFAIPEADGGSGPSLATEVAGETATTTIKVPFLALPKEPGRHAMLLPPIPIAVARSSGEYLTLCTAPHPILIEDPIANEADPKVKPNPDPRPQREEWVLAKQLTLGLLIGLVIGAVAAWLLRRWLRRARVVAAPPPKLPWIAALEELAEIRRSRLLADKRTDEYFDRVSDCVRKYLGARYGFDGLESTTDEMETTLKRVRPKVPELAKIRAFLADCDLVKFARMVPTESDCLELLERGRLIVVTTTPAPTRPAAAPDDDVPPIGPQPPPRAPPAGSYKHMTLPNNYTVLISVVAV